MFEAPEEKTEFEGETAVEIAAETMLGDLMALVIDELKAAQKSWQELSETEQQYALSRVQSRARSAVQKCVRIVSSNNLPVMAAAVEQVVFKDGCKVVLKPEASELRLDLAEHVGNTVMIVIASSAEYYGTDTAPEAEADQRALEIDEAETESE